MARRVPLNAELYAEIVKHPKFQRENLAYAIKTGKDPGDTPRETANLAYKTFYRPDGSPKQYRRMSREPASPLAKYLERIGVREEGSPYRVGETPKRR